MVTDLCVLGENPPCVTISALPDEILINIFDFSRFASFDRGPYMWPVSWPKTWHNLVHVCRRWRSVVFSSPLRLDVRLYVTGRTSVKEMLDIWPPLPIAISSYGLGDNILAALEHRDRICRINLRTESLANFERLSAVMQKPFPVLKGFFLGSLVHMPALPVGFLEGSTSLKVLSLTCIPFPTLPQLLLSCNHLSVLQLLKISDLGYISPEAMVTGLSALTMLKYLSIDFGESRTIRGPPGPLLTRTILPALTQFKFMGVYAYLEDLLARIDAPQLKTLKITFRQCPADTRQVVSHSQTLGPFHRAKVTFSLTSVDIQLYPSEETDPPTTFELSLCEVELGQQIASLAQLCTLSSPLLSSVTELDIESDESFSHLVEEDLEVLMDNPEWLVFFHSFVVVRYLSLNYEIQSCIVSSLRSLLGDTEESMTKILPNFRNLFLHHGTWRDTTEEQWQEL
jgi:F-box-like